jgi:ATP-dependent DNA ligase
VPRYTRGARPSEGEVRRADAATEDGNLPDGEAWRHELKLDGYRAIAFERGGTVHLCSRNDKDFAVRYPDVAKALAKLPDDIGGYHARYEDLRRADLRRL